MSAPMIRILRLLLGCWIVARAGAAGVAQTAGAEVNENTATPVARLKTAEGFQVELLFSVPEERFGSWVNLAVDDKGRLLVSDQYGGLFRFAPPAAGARLRAEDVEAVPAKIRAVNGMVWAFGALYAGVNDYERKIPSGLYRLTDSDGDDRLDQADLLRAFQARGDHGVHAVLLSPERDSLFLVTGNSTAPTRADLSRAPRLWGEDHLLERMPDGRGHNRGVLAPGGIIYEVDPQGERWEIYSMGYRNIFDAAFHRDGELFTFDADMEYDFNTPWYRPTRVNHVTSGSDYGWRHGAGKRPVFYPDTLPAAIDVGPGSPTGVAFGYGARFPARYQEALYLLDWSWGKIYAARLRPSGSSYVGEVEEFLSGAPLPVTDALIHPEDGAMYFTIGGRRVQSGLYRVTYTGEESVAPARPAPPTREERRARAVRRLLERYHGRVDPSAVKRAWPYLDHKDRFIRWAARTAVESQPASQWAERALTEPIPGKRTEALLALVRAGGVDPLHRRPDSPAPDTALRDRVLGALAELDWAALDRDQRLALARTYQIAFHRLGGRPGPEATKRALAQLEPAFPASQFALNWVLCETLAYLDSTKAAPVGIALMQAAATQEEQMQYARSLRFLRAGWTEELRTAYFEWFLRAANYRGGASFTKFIEFIRNDAIASLSSDEKAALADLLAKTPEPKSPLEALAEALSGRAFVRDWTLEELAAAAEEGLVGRDFQNGRKMFGAAGCFACHRFANEGGMTGPDLTGAGGRYSPRDLLDQILHPSKEINEQFTPTVLTKTNGEAVMGVIVNLNGDSVTLNTDLANPNQRVRVDRKEVADIAPSTVSTMPPGLLNMLTQDEVLDLTAYVLSGGDSAGPMFAPAAPERGPASAKEAPL